MRAQKGKKKRGRETFCLLREYMNNHKQNACRNMKEGEPCYKVAKNSAELCCSVLWKVELASDKIRFLSRMLKKKVWFLLIASSKK